MKILITGASSFVGVHVVKAFVKEGHQVFATYKSNKDILLPLMVDYDNLQLIRLNIGEYFAFDALPKNIDVIVHIAGLSGWNNPSISEMLTTNIIGSDNISKYAVNARAKKIIYASSLSIHGNVASACINDETPVVNPNIYGASKYLPELIFQKISNTIPTIVIRLPGVLGRNAHGAWLTSVAQKLLKNEEIIAFGPENYFNNALYVADLAEYIKYLSLGGKWIGFAAFPIGTSNAIKIKELLPRLKRALKSNSEIKFFKNEKESFVISSEIAISQFAYKPATIEWVLDRYSMDVLTS